MIIVINLKYRAFFKGLSRIKVQKHDNPTALGTAWLALEMSATEGEASSGCIGPAGSVAVVCNNTWHAVGANRTLAPRVAAAISYAPWYLGRITMDMVPITPAAFGRLQAAAGRALTKHQLGWLSTGEAADAMGSLPEASQCPALTGRRVESRSKDRCR